MTVVVAAGPENTEQLQRPRRTTPEIHSEICGYLPVTFPLPARYLAVTWPLPRRYLPVTRPLPDCSLMT